ncbi:MAG: tRNA-dihydrouridine synthase family protein [Planctomycetes bacterium]|nr:tRNA-dihydrouridine synthase family protein [Planctomycetota bacterium]
MDLRATLNGAVIMAPMTKGGNLPYRRLCAEEGATITMGEMALARKLLRGHRPEFALLKRGEHETCFAAQLAGNNAQEMAEAARIAAQRGADFVDVNCGCPIDDMTRRGLGSALMLKPKRIRTIVEAMVQAIAPVPVTVKIRLGFTEERNHLEVAQAAVDGGASAITVHGRTRTARYRRAADWDAVGEVVRAVSVPVIGNGDILFPHEITAFRAQSGCAGVMIARGALIKPWIFREAREGPIDLDAQARLALYARYVKYGREHFGADERGDRRLREFLLWHLGFWCRHVPQRPDGTFPTMQVREQSFEPRSELEALLYRQDTPAIEWLCTMLMQGADVAGPVPPPSESRGERSEIAEG